MCNFRNCLYVLDSSAIWHKKLMKLVISIRLSDVKQFVIAWLQLTYPQWRLFMGEGGARDRSKKTKPFKICQDNGHLETSVSL